MAGGVTANPRRRRAALVIACGISAALGILFGSMAHSAHTDSTLLDAFPHTNATIISLDSGKFGAHGVITFPLSTAVAIECRERVFLGSSDNAFKIGQKIGVLPRASGCADPIVSTASRNLVAFSLLGLAGVLGAIVYGVRAVRA